ncbi:hypothetical protein KI387_020920, partial [Taxus chinensis]
VESRATSPEIKRSFRKLAIHFHPDKLASTTVHPEEQNRISRCFRQIHSAYQILSNPKDRNRNVNYVGRCAPERRHANSNVPSQSIKTFKNCFDAEWKKKMAEIKSSLDEIMRDSDEFLERVCQRKSTPD